VYFFFLSGIPRHISYHLGAACLFPARIVLAFGIFTLLSSQLRIPPNSQRRYSRAILVMALACFVSGMLEQPTLQKFFVIAAGLLTFQPLLRAPSWRDLDRYQRPFLILAWLAFLGQSSDAIKLIDGLLGFKYQLPYVNRFTLPPILLMSFANLISHFSNVFVELRRHLFRLKSNTRTSLILANAAITEKEIEGLIGKIRRSIGVRRVSLLKLETDDTYRVLSVSGIREEAIGSRLRASDHLHILRTYQSGCISFDDVSSDNDLWVTSRCAAVPIPERKNPKYILLLSDPKNKAVLQNSDTPYLSQFASALWSNLERSEKIAANELLEKKIRDLFRALDPELYRFVTEAIQRTPEGDLRVSDNRGIIFFDQKGYSTLLEDWDETKAATLAETMTRWLATGVARYNGRVAAFEGDACLVEVVGLQGESRESIGERTANIVWNLVSSMPQLNQDLLKNDLEPVSFRFGAHFGKTATIGLDMIHNGLKNSVGNNVIIAKRIQQIAPVGKVFISEELATLVIDNFEIRPVADQHVKGRKQIVRIQEIIGKRGGEYGAKRQAEEDFL